MSNAEASTSRKEHKHKSKKDKAHKDKSKSKHKSSKSKGVPGGTKAQRSVDGPFELRNLRMRLAVPPKFSSDYLDGVRETLDGMLMRYVPQMNGVLLAHWDHSIPDDTVKIINECPFGVCEVQFCAIVWAPRVGQVLSGTHSLSSPSHLSLLFAKTFNVSIPLQHIPTDTYEFEHSETPEDEDYSSDEEEEGFSAQVGRWKETGSGKVLGSAGERVQFTVIGLQVTNQMLSLTGSLLSDPSKPQEIKTDSRVKSASPELEEPEPAAKVARVSKPKPAPRPVVAAVPEVDTTGMTARELKQLRKEQEKAKREARKARKGEAEGEGDAEGVPSLKRKAEEPEGGVGKKRKA